MIEDLDRWQRFQAQLTGKFLRDGMSESRANRIAMQTVIKAMMAEREQAAGPIEESEEPVTVEGREAVEIEKRRRMDEFEQAIIARQAELAEAELAAAATAPARGSRSRWPQGENEIRRLLSLRPMSVCELGDILGVETRGAENYNNRVRTAVTKLYLRGVIERVYDNSSKCFRFSIAEGKR